MKKLLTTLLTIVFVQSQLFGQTGFVPLALFCHPVLDTGSAFSSTSLHIYSSAAASTKTGGFNASLMIDAQVNEQSHKEKTDSNKASSLVATKGDVKLKAENNINQVGSAVISEKGDIEYEAGQDDTCQ